MTGGGEHAGVGGVYGGVHENAGYQACGTHPTGMLFSLQLI